MVQYPYVVIAPGEANVNAIMLELGGYNEFYCVGKAVTNDDAVNLIIGLEPQLVILELPSKGKNHISLDLITELHRYISHLPYFIVIAESDSFAFKALKHGVSDYLLNPVPSIEMRKSLFRFKKSDIARHLINIQQHPVIEDDKESLQEILSQGEAQRSEVDIQICIKSYGDYQFIALKDILYLQADNNTTDFYLVNGKKFTAYKTLKHYENNLPPFFFRIHNSYIVNCIYISRINTGKQLCYLNNNEISVSFSKTFKDNIDTIIRQIAPEYL